QTNGDVRATLRSDLVAQVAGRIIEVSDEFVEGGRFLAGETLLRIEDTDYQAALNEAEARVAAAKVDLETAHADADVARKQLAGVEKPSPLALKKPQVTRAQLALEAAQSGLSLAKTNLERTKITLPYAGRLRGTSVDLGEYVGPGKVLASAFGTDRVEVRLPLTDNQLGALGVPIGYRAPSGGGLAVDLTAKVAGEQRLWTGRVERLDAAIDPETRVIYATAVVNKPYDLTEAPAQMPLAVGLFVEAAIAGRILTDTIAISSDGLRAGDRVFILDANGQLEIRAVEVIHSNTRETFLAGGIAEGEAVIISAIRNPIPGMALEPINAAPEAIVIASEPAVAD
ncbi:MAG: efflux RND transporter periplasmic adaptor subunit, partial [Halieaceae bacterium]|nr:efflux RND transporter periplasmic adaptor subunit [Halieaceae bacterium]